MKPKLVFPERVLSFGNTVGSPKEINLIINYMISLSRDQLSVLIGTILGDGYLQKTGKKNARLRLEQGGKQKDYLLWKVKLLSPLFQGKAKYLERIHPITKHQYSYWRHQSQSSPYLGKLRTIFYPDGRKIIPDNLGKYFTPLMLAVWFMDDGYYYARDHCSYLYLGNVTEKETEIVQKTLTNKFGLITKALRKKNGYAIYFSPKESQKLKELIKGHTISLFNYKFPS